jgi:hypothetical protein
MATTISAGTLINDMLEISTDGGVTVYFRDLAAQISNSEGMKYLTSVGH